MQTSRASTVLPRNVPERWILLLSSDEELVVHLNNICIENQQHRISMLIRTCIKPFVITQRLTLSQ